MSGPLSPRPLLPHRLFVALSLALCSLSAGVLAEEADPTQLDAVEVQGVKQRIEQAGRLADTIEKTEVISSDDLQRRQAGSLAQAIDNTPGIRVQNECSMCGIKRVMINGLKGEHTTILVDGVPMHSVVSSYYGIDAITSAGIESIEVARGPGAALATPEAIGGAINIISERATHNGVRADLSAGEDGYQRASVIATGLSKDGRAEGLISAQYDDIDNFDGDQNGVSETAAMSNRSLTARGSMDVSDIDNLDLRVAMFRSRVMGGPADASREEIYASAASGEATDPTAYFVGGDVRQRYLALPYETAEVIDTDREEAALRWTRQTNDAGDNLQLTASFISHGQDSIYEGFDYVNDDDIVWLDAKYSMGIGDAHLLSFGINQHDEKMRSESLALQALQADDPSITSDAFNYAMRGAYVQGDFYFGEALELSLAGRFDQIQVDYIDQGDDDEMDESLFSPRALLKYTHSEAWTSRLSAGRGYRAPLSFFESDHGLLDSGYDVAVDALERSLSVGYSLSYASERSAVTASLSSSKIDNLAYIDFDAARPRLLNSDETARVDTFDIELSHQVSEHWTIGGGGELFEYDRAYRDTFGVVPVEERLRLFGDYAGHGWKAFAQLTWVGSRDLTRYGTGEHYNVLNPDGTVSDPKDMVAPSYVTLDARIEKSISEHMAIYLGGTNLTDFDQAGDEESPLMYDAEGGYDVVHIWGPLRGRVLYAGLKMDF